MRSFSFICAGLECDTPEEAWETFKSDANLSFKWIKGFKIWRTIPELVSDKRFSEGVTIFQVRARALAFDDLPKDYVEATIEGPYKSYFNDPEAEAYLIHTLESEK